MTMKMEILGDNYLELIDQLTGGIRYTSVTKDPMIEKVRIPQHFDPIRLGEVERREQDLIAFWNYKKSDFYENIYQKNHET